MIKVLIADDHTIVRKGMLQVLSAEPEIKVVDEAGCGQEALDKIRPGRHDVVVLDIALPGKNGLEVLKQIKSLHPSLPVLMLSMYPEDHYAIRVLKAGAAGYITKDNANKELISAIKVAAAGRKYITPSLAEMLARELTPQENKPPHEKLNDREFNILCLIARGKGSTEIADEMALSVKTVGTYRARLLEKMAMRSNAELTHYAIQNRLVE